MMGLLSFCLAFVGFAALCLAMRRHSAEHFRGARSAAFRRALAAVGWLALALSFGPAVAAAGWAVGPIEWSGLLTASALLWVLLWSYRPRLAVPSAALALLVAVAAAAV